MSTLGMNRTIAILVRLLLLCFAGCLGGSCATLRVDCYFHVFGNVTADTMPLDGVLVELEIEKPVFKAITPVKRARTVTDEKGQFNFSYLDDCSLIEYSIVFRKEGFKEVILKRTNRDMEPYDVKLEKGDDKARSYPAGEPGTQTQYGEIGVND